jgi:hypothetical protein
MDESAEPFTMIDAGNLYMAITASGLMTVQCGAMGILGKESSRDKARADAFKAWITARAGESIISLGAGVVAILDAFTVVVGILAGVLAITCGYRGLKRIAQQPDLLGKRLCVAGMILGSMGIAMSLILWLVVYPNLTK